MTALQIAFWPASPAALGDAAEPEPLGVAVSAALTDNRMILLGRLIYNNHQSIQFNVIVFT